MSDIRRVWVTRAQPGADRTAERLLTLGFTPLVAPLLALRPLNIRPDLTGVQALAFTSRNAVRVFAESSDDRALPVFAVGDATATSAHEAGFTDIRSAAGDLHALAALIRIEASGLSILHPCAAEPAGDLAALVGEAARVTSLAIYEAIETNTVAPEAWDAVLIHSPRAGRALAASLPPDAAQGRIALAISDAAAQPLRSPGFAQVRVAEAPTESSLLAALGKRGTSV